MMLLLLACFLGGIAGLLIGLPFGALAAAASAMVVASLATLAIGVWRAQSRSEPAKTSRSASTERAEG